MSATTVLFNLKNHKHKLTKVVKVDATCTKPGSIEYYTCDGCSDFFGDKEGETKITDTVIAPFGHKISDDWNYDENNHWRICSVCNEILAETQMAHEIENEKCTTCGYDGTTIKIETNADIDADTNNNNTDNTDSSLNNDSDGNNLSWLWIVLAIVIVAGGGFAFYWFVFKKNSKV